MKDMKTFGMVGGVIGGAVCVLGGLLCLLLGLIGVQQGSFGSTIPPGLYWAMGLYFIGKGIFAAGISLNAAGRKSS